ncbi:endo-1,4-beta-xylanase [Massilia glaciei]|nr:endo-1,4-beta-xylanase [Massilia glaciei]
MPNFKHSLIAMLLGAASAAASPLGASPLPPLGQHLGNARPTSVLPADPATSFRFEDGINPADKRGSFTVTGESAGAPVFRADNPKGSSNYNGINARWFNSAPIKKGDVLLARFAARALKARQESGEAEGMFYFQRQKESSDRAVQAFSVGPDWTTISVPFVAADYAAVGESAAMISFGNLEQTLEITGLEVLNFQDRARMAALPVTRFTYAGREADAAWRRAALARIERIRTAPLTVRVRDARGRPLKGATVEVAMTRSAFLWGSEVDAGTLLKAGPDADRYRQEVRDLFDVTVLGNGLKWPRWRAPGGPEQALGAIDWLRAEGKLVKGHALVWPAWKFSPKDVAADPERGSKIGGLVDAHIADITATTRGKLIGWDVVNEPIHETEYLKHMPRERVATWFKLAQRSDPALQLSINEYSMLNRSSSPLFIEKYLEFVAMLRKEGARVDVLGVQGHVGQTPRPPLAVLSDLDLLADGGVNNIQITEYDFNTPDEQLQADYNRDFMIALYSHKNVSGFLQWGFWQGAIWKPDAAMFRRDWSAKPSLAPWKELVRGAWRTRNKGATGADGAYTSRGHHGQYEVSVSYKGKTVRKPVVLGGAGETLTLTVK